MTTRFIAQNVVDFQSFLNQVSAVYGKNVASQVNFLFQHYAYTEGHAEQKVAQRMIDLVNEGKLSSIQAQCEKFGYSR